MNWLHRASAVLAFAVLLAVVSITVYGQRQTSSSANIQEIAQPDSIVPFTADLLKRGSDHTFEGKYYRREDGSVREEGVVTIPGARPERVIGIVNLTRKITYIFKESQGWASGAIEADLAKPMRRRLNQPGVMSGLFPEEMPYEGRVVYRGVGSTGDYELLAPDLNFFAVVTQSARSGRRAEYHNITIGSQPDALFELPAGAVVTTTFQPIRPSPVAKQ